MKIRVGVAFIGVVLALPFAAASEEIPVYESLSEVTVGRVFFSARQRAHLDSLRGKSSVVSPRSASAPPTASKPENSDAAGFIVRTSGKTRIYRNGEFIEVGSESEVQFPDEVAVTRKALEASDAEDDKTD